MTSDPIHTTRLWLETYAALDPAVRSIMERLRRLERLSPVLEPDWARPELRELASQNPVQVHLVAAALAAIRRGEE